MDVYRSISEGVSQRASHRAQWIGWRSLFVLFMVVALFASVLFAATAVNVAATQIDQQQDGEQEGGEQEGGDGSEGAGGDGEQEGGCLLYTSPSPRD